MCRQIDFLLGTAVRIRIKATKVRLFKVTVNVTEAMVMVTDVRVIKG